MDGTEIALILGALAAIGIGIVECLGVKAARKKRRRKPAGPPLADSAAIARGMAEAQAARELEHIDDALASSTPAADLAALGRRRK
jgi:hypothetical protein